MGQVLSHIIRYIFGVAEDEERPSDQNQQISPPISDSCGNSSIELCIESITRGMVIDSSIQVAEDNRQFSPPFPNLNTGEPREEDQAKEEDNEEVKLIISEEVAMKERWIQHGSSSHSIQVVEDSRQFSPPFPNLNTREPIEDDQAKEEYNKEEKLIISEEMVMNERWIQHYSSSDRILLVGEGDFSFSAALALAFGFATNMVASSLDSRDVVIRMYKNAKSNLENLEKLGACLLHGVDATKMKLHTDLQMQKFDRVIFNFPHAGFLGKEDHACVIEAHRNLVHGFFKNASCMLHANGEIHVSHKTAVPFCRWNLEELASQNSLALIERVDFNKKDYPGYNNKRGAGLRCDEAFPLGECSTFKFRLSPTAKKMSSVTNHLDLTYKSRRLEEIFIPMQQPQTSPDFPYPRTHFIANMNDVPGYIGPPSTINIRDDCSRIFCEYFNHVEQTFGRSDYDVGSSVHEGLRLGFERYMAEEPGRTLNGYIDVLHELHRLSIMRSAWLRRMLTDPNNQL